MAMKSAATLSACVAGVGFTTAAAMYLVPSRARNSAVRNRSPIEEHANGEILAEMDLLEKGLAPEIRETSFAEVKKLMNSMYSMRLTCPRTAPSELHRVTFNLRAALKKLLNSPVSPAQRLHIEELHSHLDDHIERTTHNVNMWSSSALESPGC